MKKNLLLSALAIVTLAATGTLRAQTNPTAVSLPFSLTSQSSVTPASGVAVHRFSSIPTSRIVTPATGDLPNQGSTPTNNAGGWYNLGTDGIGMLASGTNPAGAIVVAVNTTGQTNIQVSWLCKTIYNQSARDNSVALQYRIGTTGNFTNVGTTTTYSSAGNANGHSSATLTETLPAAADNQAVVQLRWIYWESVSTSGSRDKIAVDDISITGSLPSCPAPGTISATGVTSGDALLSWSAVAGATAYEYALTTSATPPASGTAIATTSQSISSLSASTTYYFHLRSSCGGGLFSGWTTQSFTTLSAPVCNPPATINVTGITTTGASVSWSSFASATAYEYVVSTSAMTPGSGTNTVATSYNATGLTANTTYYVFVSSLCDTSIFSDWAMQSFVTNEDVVIEDSPFVVMTYNLLNYPGSTGTTRDPSFRTIVGDVQPDIMVVQELSTNGFNTFQNNVMEQVDTNYTGGTFVDGPDSDNGIYFKRARFQFISNTPIHTALRDINEFRLKHLASGDTLIIFSVHLKASDAAADEAQRADEIDSLRKRTNTFGSCKYFLVCGDFNIYKSSESCYQKMIQTGSNVNGKFNDIISISGTWNNSAYAIHHTQSPRTTSFGGGATGGMDDRFDMLLFSDAIVQPGGFDIVSGSYKAYGNDGAHYNQALNTPPYTMYSSTIAAALHDVSDHIPVVVKLEHAATASRLFNGTNAVGSLPVSGDQVSVFPNPTQGILYLQATKAPDAPIHFNLYDLNGRMVREVVLSGTGTVTVDLSELNAGIYFLRCPESGAMYKVVRY